MNRVRSVTTWLTEPVWAAAKRCAEDRGMGLSELMAGLLGRHLVRAGRLKEAPRPARPGRPPGSGRPQARKGRRKGSNDA